MESAVMFIGSLQTPDVYLIRIASAFAVLVLL